ncbi:hypothetical protein MPTK1_8g10120 [Marchantia polymorpha subsp. ruderalis]|nr:hypothetical protein MARPO_0008s0210 [Marchantia polymorpha]|eukprot:PTQ47460.1 hypothetical protein MARPO_0008s0210 [Marchantia polymorpha]
MEFFEKAKLVRLKSLHGKYLWADDDGYKVFQCREPMNVAAHWRVERDPDCAQIRLVSCHKTYLTASDDNFLTGMTGKKVVQSKPRHIDSSVEWEPIREGSQVKLKTCHGNFLRANKALGPPWRNSVTHDIPHRMAKHQEYLLWEIETVFGTDGTSSGALGSSHGGGLAAAHAAYVSSGAVSISNHSPTQLGTMIGDSDPMSDGSPPGQSPESSPPHRRPVYGVSVSAHSAYVPSTPSPSVTAASATSKPPEGRTIHYAVASDIEEARRLDGSGWPTLNFKGHTLSALKKQLKEVLELDDDIYLCARHHTNSNLYELKLPTLPPNNAAMHIVVVKLSSSVKKSKSIAEAVSMNGHQ